MSKNPTVSFRVYDEKHQKVKSLIHCFLKETNFSKDDYLNLKHFGVAEGRGEDKTTQIYSVYWDDSIFPDICELKNKEYMPCVVSFQKHTHGRFAVIKKKEY